MQKQMEEARRPVLVNLHLVNKMPPPIGMRKAPSSYSERSTVSASQSGVRQTPTVNMPSFSAVTKEPADASEAAEVAQKSRAVCKQSSGRVGQAAQMVQEMRDLKSNGTRRMKNKQELDTARGRKMKDCVESRQLLRSFNGGAPTV